MFGPPLFFTATILNWHPLLLPVKNKLVIANSLMFMVKEKRAQVYGFVVMPNHVHALLRLSTSYPAASFQRDFLKFTGQVMKLDLLKNDIEQLQHFKSTQGDRKFQIWERRPKWITITDRNMAFNTLHYIHNNPLQQHWNLCLKPADYRFSSAAFYEGLPNEWAFLSHIHDIV